MNNNELLQAISDMLDEKLETKLEEKLEEKLETKLDKKLDQKLDQKLEPIYERLDGIDKHLDVVDERLDEVDEQLDGIKKGMEGMKQRLTKIEITQEVEILPCLRMISTCYTDTYKRYQAGTEQIDAMQTDIDVMKKITYQHGERLERLERIS